MQVTAESQYWNEPRIAERRDTEIAEAVEQEEASR